MQKSKTRFLTQASTVAAIYVALTFVSSLLGLSSGAIQIRFSEALTILPMFLPSAIPGLFIGCVLSNLLTGCAVYDIIFGSIATLIGACLTRKLKNNLFFAISAPILSNTLIIPFVIKFAYCADDWFLFIVAGVFIGEIISCGIGGYFVHKYIIKTGIIKKDG